jgi:hypothetical protein
MNQSTINTSQNVAGERPPIIMEHLPHQPYELLNEVFSSPSRCETLKSFIHHWLHQFDSEHGIYKEKDQVRASLEKYYFELINLIDALHNIIDEKRLFSALQLTTDHHDSIAVLRRFCGRYTGVYTRRELWYFMHAVFEFSTGMTGEFQPHTVLDWYEQVSALTEVAYLLHARASLPGPKSN